LEPEETPSESEHILKIVSELCRRLDITPTPEVVSWQDRYYQPNGQPNPASFGYNTIGRPVTPDFPVIFKNKILLKPMMKGILEQEEWRPLLASSLIYYEQLREQYNKGGLLRFSPMFLALGIFLTLGAMSLAMGPNSPVPLTPLEFVIYGVTAVPAAGIYSVFLATRFSTSLGLMADRKAAEVVGQDKLLQVLQRLDALRQQDIQGGRLKNWIGYGNLPILPKRLENIRNLQLYETTEDRN